VPLCKSCCRCFGPAVAIGPLKVIGLSVNLPASLPTALAQARIGRDKIAGACDVRERTSERVIYRIPAGRPGTSTPGDENALIDAGHDGDRSALLERRSGVAGRSGPGVERLVLAIAALASAGHFVAICRHLGPSKLLQASHWMLAGAEIPH